jgi:hypothetical protein
MLILFQAEVEAQEATEQWTMDRAAILRQAETLPPVALLHPDPEAAVYRLVECLIVEISQEARQSQFLPARYPLVWLLLPP